MPTIPFFPYDVTYRIVDGKPLIYLYGRALDDGRRLIVIDDSHLPAFYAIARKDANIEALREKISKLSLTEDGEDNRVLACETVEKKLLSRPTTALKITVNLPYAVPKISKLIREWESIVSVHEYDILFVRRYLIDKGLTLMTKCEVEGEVSLGNKSRVRVIKAASIRQASEESYLNPRVLSIDIETYIPLNKSVNMEQNPILTLALYGDGMKKVLSWKHFPNAQDYVEFVDSESSLLVRFKELVEEYRPDIITGYFSDGFDMPYIKARADKYKILLDLGPDYSELKVRGRDEAECSINGMLHIDIFKFIKRVMRGALETEAYNLNAVSKELLGESKKEVSLDELSDAWDNHPEKLAPFAEYNLQDAHLAYHLLLKMLPTIIELVKIVGLPPFDINRVGFSQMVEWFLIKEAHAFNEIAPNKPDDNDMSQRRMTSLVGGFVFEPKPGLYRDLVVFDYLSLYPTIIISHNIGPGTFLCECCKTTQKRIPENINWWFCEKNKGFIPTLVEDIITRRLRVKQLMKDEKDAQQKILLDARQGALKLMANSFYGYLGFSAARWYSLESAQSTTALGRHYIKQVISKATDAGFSVVYSDTDSVFLSRGQKTKEESLAFMEAINKELPGMMELDFEGFYSSGIFVSAKADGEHGAKKKYALLNETGKMKIRGFELVRRNWAPIARTTQEQVLNIVLREHDAPKAVSFTKDIIAQLRSKKLPIENVIMRMQLVKDLGDYASKGPHVAAAEKLRARGEKVGAGSIIQYVVVEGGSVIRDRVKLPDEMRGNEYDAEYYIENQVVPAVDRIFDVFGISSDELLGKGKQQSLSSFFG